MVRSINKLLGDHILSLRYTEDSKYRRLCLSYLLRTLRLPGTSTKQELYGILLFLLRKNFLGKSQGTARNHIHFLCDLSDRKIVDISEIKTYAATYFEGILGSTVMPFSPVPLDMLRELLPFRNYQKAACPKSCMVKVDIRKAFDTVCWDFVLKVLAAQGFPHLFCAWIKKCISSPRFSISINGELAAAATNGQIRLHPNCTAPQVTHLLFADDLLVFSDGARHSLTGVAEPTLEAGFVTTILHFKDMKDMSGLDMNPGKSEIFFGGYSDTAVDVLSALTDIKVKLISSVIYGMVNFWSAVFNLPKMVYAKVDSLCASFLWKNKVGSAQGARVAWTDVCRPKNEGGLGIRRSSFWVMKDSQRLSRTVKCMLKLKSLLKDFLHCEIGDGKTASFWFSHWCDLGPLVDFLGINGTRQLRVAKNATVKDAARNGEWLMPAARSEAQQTFMALLTTIPPPSDSNGSDTYLWRRLSGSFANLFSSKETWEQLRSHSPVVPWCKAMWFKEAVSRYSFITWLAMLGRLPTKDRLRSWGMAVSAECVLCSTGIETHDHLFFNCIYSTAVWEAFAARLWPSPPSDLLSISSWILQTRSQPHAQDTVIIKLILQSACYLIWRERNARIFKNIASASAVTNAALDRSLRDTLLSFPASSASSPSLLAFYFGCVNFPF
ncbi:unnamed protein product [Arabidopsis halleri]